MEIMSLEYDPEPIFALGVQMGTDMEATITRARELAQRQGA